MNIGTISWSSMMEDIHESGLTYREIGEMLGISQGTAHDIESGRIKEPGGTVALKIVALHKKCARHGRKKP
jgi:DNA-binding XRE family transcriptional regulator